jgi:propanediol dehydratase small subunit
VVFELEEELLAIQAARLRSNFQKNILEKYIRNEIKNC